MWPICHTDIDIHGATIQSDIDLTTGCRITTHGITASIFMSALVGIGPATIDIVAITGMAAIPIIGTAHMLLPSRIKM